MAEVMDHNGSGKYASNAKANAGLTTGKREIMLV